MRKPQPGTGTVAYKSGNAARLVADGWRLAPACRWSAAGRIKSIIEPRLADHVRREALKFLNELERAV